MVSLDLTFTELYCTGADTKGETIIVAAVGDLHTNELRLSLITIFQLVLPFSMNCMIPNVFIVTMEGISVPVVTAKGAVVKGLELCDRGHCEECCHGCYSCACRIVAE